MSDPHKYNIRVDVSTRYLPDQSNPDGERYTFAYTIRISNEGQVPSQLISRHWIITDAEQQVQEVRGLGVVGEQPTLNPGQMFEYTSGCTLRTPVGTMKGSYQMKADDGEEFEAPVAEFLLSMPRTLH